MTIEAEYYRWGRHKCEWVYRGVEEVAENDVVNHYFLPATVEMMTDEDARGNLANIVVKNDSLMRIRATLWRNGAGEEISTAFPILLVAGEILTLNNNNLKMDLSFSNEPIVQRFGQVPQGASLQQIQDQG